MKKLIISSALCLAAALSLHAQGTVFFNNGNTTRVSTNAVTTATAGTGLTGAGSGGYYYALFFSTSANNVGGSTSAVIGANGSYVFNAANSASWTLATAVGGGSLLGTNTLAAGRLQSSVTDSTSVTQIGNLAGGTSAQWVMVGWSANIGNSITALESFLAGNGPALGWVGESNVSGPIAPGILNNTATASIWGSGTSFINGFTLGEAAPTTVPEPGTIALACLGGASLLLFRRRK